MGRARPGRGGGRRRRDLRASNRHPRVRDVSCAEKAISCRAMLPRFAEALSMKVAAVLGGQWGDEGKGKVVDLLASRFDVVARYHGGHNAGHTVKFADRHFALHLLPAGIVRGAKSVIGPGVVVDPDALLAEIASVEEAGIRVEGKLLLSDRAPL